MRSIALLVARLVLGGYMIAHGAQKLFGAFGGHGLEGTGGFFENIGLAPGKQMAALAGASELGGGVLTATGIAYPLGPLMVAGTMAVASTTHRANGALASNGGFELPLTNLAAASALAAAGPGKLRVGRHLPAPLAAVAGLAGAGMAVFAISKLLSGPSEQPGAVPAPSEASTGGAGSTGAASGGNGAAGSADAVNGSNGAVGKPKAPQATGGPATSQDGAGTPATAQRGAEQA
ncbi:MAG: DoxX family protein [Acidimicrobiales bacterium]